MGTFRTLLVSTTAVPLVTVSPMGRIAISSGFCSGTYFDVTSPTGYIAAPIMIKASIIKRGCFMKLDIIKHSYVSQIFLKNPLLIYNLFLQYYFL